jgi:hypothetical protein
MNRTESRNSVVLSGLLFVVLASLFTGACAAGPEFGGQCAMGMSQGIKQSTNCTVLWVGPDDKLYCFSSAEAKAKFLQSPQENLGRAQAFWEDPENLKRLLRRE